MRLRKPSPAMIVACIALMFSMTGTGIAASHYLITNTHQIKPSVLDKLKGSQGAAGPQGAAGAPGPQGQSGVILVKGEAGPAGPAGLKGFDGVEGNTGAIGPEGSTGPTGPMGERGPAGPAGKEGPPASIYVQENYIATEGSNEQAVSVLCPEGDNAIGGGFNTGNDEPVEQIASYPAGRKWVTVLHDPGGADGHITFYTICLA